MKFKRNKGLICLVVILCFTMGVTFGVRGRTDMEQKRDELKSQSDNISKEINDTKSEILKQKQRKAQLDTEIYETQDQIRITQEQILKLDEEISSKMKIIKDLEKDVEKNNKLFKQSLNLLFKCGGEVSTINILLNCSDVNSLFHTYQMIKSLNERQNKVIEAINSCSEKITCEKNNIENKRKQVSEKKKEFEKKKANLYNLLNESDSLIERLNSVEEEKVKELDLNSEEIKSLDDQITSYYKKQEEERRLREAREAQAKAANKASSNNTSSTTTTISPSGTGYAWPTPGFTTLTSPYNEWRGTYSHRAIDIGGYNIYGTPVVAAQDGVVISAVDGCRHYSANCRCGGGYGNYVVIDHGDGRSTLYAHQCRLAVHVGQHVKKGQVIGYVGSTGHSTGPHLHYETRKYVNGTIQRYNPMSEY